MPSPAGEGREVQPSTGQRLLWLLDHYRGGGGTVNAPLAWRLRGPVSERALQEALDGLVERHEALRTSYVTRGRRLVARVHPPRPLELERCEPPAGSAPREEAIMAAAHERARTRMDVTVSPIAAALWTIGDDDRLLLLTIHHLATDFVSNMIISRDLGHLYDRATGATVAELPPIGWQYSAWAEHQVAAFAAGRLERLQAFWRDRLSGARPPLLPRPGGAAGPARSARATRDLAPALVERLRAIALEARSTMFAVMLAGFFAHLHRVTGQRDVAIASLFTNRTPSEVEHTVGFFVSMIVLRAHVAPGATFVELVRASRSTVVGALAHAELPYHMLPPGTVQSDGEARIDDVVFQYLDAPPGRPTGLPLQPLEITVNAGRFALELVVHSQSRCMLRYDAGRIDDAWATDFLAGYEALLDEVSRAPGAAADGGAIAA
jgi:hypothetical protein